ncbi:MAG: hypothetical protein ACRYG7_07630 [Janthinobacterium lividum]
MLKFLLVLATAIFLYSPLGPSWGQDAVNVVIVLFIFSLIGKAVPKRRYY